MLAYKLEKWGVLVSIVIVWIVGLFFYDSWLRPWPPILFGCGTLTLAILIAYVLAIRQHRLIAALLVVLCAFLIVPMPSFTLVATVENFSKSPVDVEFRSSDGKRFKKFHLDSGKEWRFRYFSGDFGGSKSISSVVIVMSPSRAVLAKSDVMLPISGPNLHLRILDDIS
ncbi:MAG: hypothetical protein ACXWJX_01855, partial [Limisphaerales bacterium]